LPKNRLSDFDLQQIGLEYAASLSVDVKDRLIASLADELREARDRLNQNSQNSSRPPRTEQPWQSVASGPECTDEERDSAASNADEKSELTDPEPGPKDKAQEEGTEKALNQVAVPKKKGKPGRRKGMKGYGRRVELPVTGEEFHHPERCSICDQSLDPAGATAWTGLYVLDLMCRAGALVGMQVTHTKHIYTGIPCSCGHVTRAEPGRCGPDEEWKVASSEWHLAGPMLVSLIVCLTKRMRCPRRLTQEFLQDWFGIYLSTSTINQCIHEAGRAVAPVEDQLVGELTIADLLHADETTWKEAGQLLWLWVFCSATVTLFLVGYRTKEIIKNLLGSEFSGWLMSDGYTVYRDYLRRLRCWAHLVRKAKGLRESLDQEYAQPFGNAALSLLEELMEAVYQAREGPRTSIANNYNGHLECFKELCESYLDCPHKKTHALAREFLNDWDAIWVVLQFPWLPLTNNEAETALRHWVIARQISHGTRTEEGSRVFGLLASVVETCRKRGISPWPYIAEVVAERRKGNPAPPIPASATA
jgi:hypothetical protein